MHFSFSGRLTTVTKNPMPLSSHAPTPLALAAPLLEDPRSSDHEGTFNLSLPEVCNVDAIVWGQGWSEHLLICHSLLAVLLFFLVLS